MHRFLKKAFWRDEFIVGSKQLDAMFHRLEDLARPASEAEVAESVVREMLEREYEFSDAKIYSPEQKYQIDEKIIFIQEKGTKYAQVLNLRHGSNPEYGPYEKIDVQFKGEDRWHTFISDCPKHLARFSKPEAGDLATGGAREFITPGHIVTRFEDPILSEMRRALLGDERFIYYDGEWWLVDEVIPINLESIEEFLRNERKPLPAEEILSDLFPGKEDAQKSLVFLFSLNSQMDRDSKLRFARVEGEGRSLWVLRAAAPPERSRYTVTEAALKEGYIEIRPGFRKMLNFYELGQEVIFSVYGEYEIEGEVDDVTGRVYGAQIADWYLENAVRSGDTVYIKAPEPDGKTLRLFTKHHEREDRKPWSEVERESRRVFLRHRIYGLFVETEQFTHYKELARRLSFRLGEKISAESVGAVLSQSGHLFDRLGPSRGIWGLRGWLTSPRDFLVDLTSLLLDVGERQIVYEILKQHSRPMDTKEVAEAIGGDYGISPQLLIEASFIDPQDRRLRRLSNGKWILAEWRGQWQRRLDEINKELEKIEELTRNKHEQRLRLSQVEHSKSLARTQEEEMARSVSSLSEEQSELRKEAEEIGGRISVLDERDSDLELQERQTQADVEKTVKARRRQFVFALCGGAARLVLGGTGGLPLGVSIGILSLIPLCIAGRAHWQNRNLSSLVSILRGKRRDIEDKIRRFCEDTEALDQSIRSGTQRLEMARDELAQHQERLVSLEEQREEVIDIIAKLQETISSYDKPALLAEREELLQLLGEMPE